MDKNLGLGKYKSDSQVSHWLKKYNHVEFGKMWFETIMIMKLVKKYITGMQLEMNSQFL